MVLPGHTGICAISCLDLVTLLQWYVQDVLFLFKLTALDCCAQAPRESNSSV